MELERKEDKGNSTLKKFGSAEPGFQKMENYAVQYNLEQALDQRQLLNKCRQVKSSILNT